MPRGIRTRIKLLAMTVTLGVCVLVCAALYTGLYVSLHREVDGFLEGEVHEFRAILMHEDDDDLEEIEREIRAELGSRRGTDLTFRLLDPKGYLLITSDPEDRFPNPWVFTKAISTDPSIMSYEDLAGPGIHAPHRFCEQRANLHERGEVIIQAAYRLDRVHRSLAACRWMCLAALLLAAVLSILGGHFVAGRSLRPVVAITEAAKHISARQLSMRVPHSGTGDELDDLANTLNEMLDRVENSFRQIRQFTADAAHELRTPLTALRGSAEFALTQPRSQDRLRGVIEQSLDYYRVLSRVTDDLLLLARLDAGQEPLAFERFSLPKLIDDIVDLYKPLATERGINIAVQHVGETWVRADQGKIRRLFSNLLDNAIKYMGGTGTVEVNNFDRNGDVGVTIADSGPGIPARDLPHVFERFYRVDGARTPKGDVDSRSVGLGLAICRSIVQAHHGEIWIESTPGHGTQVTFHLPRSKI